MKKIAIIILLLFGLAFAQSTNAPGAVFIKEGEVFTAPYTGWFFGRESTKRLLENDVLAPSLQTEVKALNLKLDAYQDINSQYQLQIKIFKEYGLLQERDQLKINMEKTLLLAGGWLVGVVSTIAIYYVANLEDKQ